MRAALVLSLLARVALADSILKDESAIIGPVRDFDCVGTQISCSRSGATAVIFVDGGAGAASDLSCSGCVSDSELANDYSGVGACSAGQFVSAVNDNAGPTCGTPWPTNVSDDGADLQLKVYSTTYPPAPDAGWATPFAWAPDGGAGALFAWMTQDGTPHIADPGLLSHWICWHVVNGSTLVSVGGTNQSATSASSSSYDLSAVNGTFWNSLKRADAIGGTGANTCAGWSVGTGHEVVRGTKTGRDGFGFFARWAIGSSLGTVTNQEFMVGLANRVASVPCANQMSAELDSVYFGTDKGGTVVNVCSNDNSGSATCTALDAGFPADLTQTDAGTAAYEGWFFGTGGNSIDWQIRRVDTPYGPQPASGTITGDLPRTTAPMYPRVWISNGGTAQAARIQVSKFCIWSPN